MLEAVVSINCWGKRGELLGQLSIFDRAVLASLEHNGQEIAISELGDYLVRFAGPAAGSLRFGSTVEPLPLASKNELIGSLGRAQGLGLVRLEMVGLDGEPRWKTDLLVRPEKLRTEAEFEEMLADLCRWRTAIVIDLHARSSAPWVWSDTMRTIAPEERLVVVRAAVEDNRLFENVALVERSALVQLRRDVELVALGREELDQFRLARHVNAPGARTRVPPAHELAKSMSSMPSWLPPARTIETIDTPENQFVKLSVRRFRSTISGAIEQLQYGFESPLFRWAEEAKSKLDRAADSTFFKRVSWPSRVALGSPALQQRQGYRSILQAFLDLRAGFSMPWDELSSAVFAETRDVPTLYEFWCLLKLRGALEEEFGADLDLAHFLTSSGRLTIKRGSESCSRNLVVVKGAPLALSLHYNRTFHPLVEENEGGFSTHGSVIGTWSKPMKPDFTVSLRPPALTEEQAATQKTLRLVHFDAKYKLRKLVGSGEATHIPDDLDKMHAYAAAINHSYGAYALFPGDTTDLLAAPSSSVAVGAIPLRPGSSDSLRPTLRIILDRTAAP